MKNQKPIVELLAPAGSYETFRAVLAAGADAVYLAGNRYGARAYAGNLSDEELLLALEEAHLHHKKIYLTVNTLVKDSEIGAPLLDYIRPLYEAGLDGVIVQDLGVLRLLRTHFPNLELHASTQMTVTNPDYIEVLKNLGVTRIVPARELSLEEIQILHDTSGMEIECFAHGALCYCYSGACFMSSFLGGRSGNRGRCAQPCRLVYEKNGKSGNYLSLKDLCTLSLLPDMVEHGVYSFKLEGRMKSTEYAAGVTAIYRKYLDLYLKNGKEHYQVDPMDEKRLLMLFDRGGMTDGYYTKHNGQDMIALNARSDKSQEAKSAYEKEVLERYGKGCARIPVIMKAKLVANGESILTICLQENEKQSVSVRTDQVVLAQSRPMGEADIAKQLTKLGNTYYEAVDCQIIMDQNIFVPNKALNELRRAAVTALSNVLLAPYQRNQEQEQCMLKQTKTDSVTPSWIGEKSADIPAWETRLCSEVDLQKGTTRLSCHVMTLEQALAVIEAGTDRLILDCEFLTREEMLEAIKTAKGVGIPAYIGLPRIMRREKSIKTYDWCNEWLSLDADGYVARSLDQLVYLAHHKPETPVLTDYTCYAMNYEAAQEMLTYHPHIVSQTFPVEASLHEMKDRKLVAPELYVYGYLPLMVTANCVDRTCEGCHSPRSGFTFITDRKHQRLHVATCCRYCYNLIYNSVPIYLADRVEELRRMKPAYLGIHFSTEKAAYTREVIDAIRKQAPYPGKSFTRGHLLKGVE